MDLDSSANDQRSVKVQTKPLKKCTARVGINQHGARTRFGAKRLIKTGFAPSLHCGDANIGISTRTLNIKKSTSSRLTWPSVQPAQSIAFISILANLEIQLYGLLRLGLGDCKVVPPPLVFLLCDEGVKEHNSQVGHSVQ